MKKIKVIISILLAATIVFLSVVCGFAVSPSDSIIPEDAVEFNGHYYKYYSLGIPWEDAKNYCEDLGGYLATITTPEEDAFLYSYINSLGINLPYYDDHIPAYFGLYKDPDLNLFWVTGEPVNYVNWNSGEPNQGSREPYGMYYNKNGRWNDGGPSTVYASSNTCNFICEWGDYTIEFDYERLKEFEHFKAWTYTLSENSMFNTQLNRELAYDLIIEDTTKAADFFSMAWQATTSDYLTDPSQYYEVVLMDIVMQQLNNPDYAKKTVDDVKDLTVDYAVEMFKNSVDDAYSAYETAFYSDVGHSSIVWEMEDEFQKKLDIYNVGVAFSRFVEAADTVGDVVEYISKAINVSKVKKELIDYFSAMQLACLEDFNRNENLFKALSEIVALYNNDFSVSIDDYVNKKVSEIVMEQSIDLIVQHFPALGPITYVWEAGSILSNVACGTNVVAEARLTMSATKQISDLMKQTSKQFLKYYLFDTGSLEKAQMTNFSFEILTTIYDYGSDLAVKYYEAVFEGGLVNINKIINSFSGKRKATAEDTLKWVKHMSGGLEELKELPNEIRNTYNSIYHGENASRLGINVENIKHSIEIITGIFVDAKDSLKQFFDGSPIDLPYVIGEYVSPHIRLENWYTDSSCLKVFDPLTDTATKPMAIYAKYIYDFYIEETSTGEAKIVSYSNDQSGSFKYANSNSAKNLITTQNTSKILEVPAYYCGYELTTICKNAFPDNISSQYDAFIIYDTVTTIEDGAFDNLGKNIIIYCEEGSEVEKYAVEHDIKHKVIGEEYNFFEMIINAIKAFVEKIIDILKNLF